MSISGFAAAVSQSWPPFALILGLLMVGLLAHRDGLIAWEAGRLQRVAGEPTGLLAAALALRLSGPASRFLCLSEWQV